MTRSRGTHYDVLGLGQNATHADIRRAYQALAVEWHPDKVSTGRAEATERFKCISDAYITLSDDDRRDAYDRQLAKDLEREYVAARETLLHEIALQRTQERADMQARYMYAQAQAQARAQATRTPPPFLHPQVSPTHYVPLSPQSTDVPGAAHLARENSHRSRHSHLSRSNSQSRHAPQAHVHSLSQSVPLATDRMERNRHSYAGPPRSPVYEQPRNLIYEQPQFPYEQPRSPYEQPRSPIYDQFRSSYDPPRSPYDLPPAHPFAPPQVPGTHLRTPHARGKSTSALDELLRNIERNGDEVGHGLSRAASFARAAKARDISRAELRSRLDHTRAETFHETSRHHHPLDAGFVLSPDSPSLMASSRTPMATGSPAHRHLSHDRQRPVSQATEAPPDRKQAPADFEHSRPYSSAGNPSRERKSFIKTKFTAASRLNPFSRTTQVAEVPKHWSKPPAQRPDPVHSLHNGQRDTPLPPQHILAT